MKAKSKNHFGNESLFKTWTAAMNNTMETISKTWAASAQPPPGKDKTGRQNDPIEKMGAAFREWQTIASAMTTPESAAAFFKGTEALPEIFTHFAQTFIKSMSEFQQKMGESAANLGKSFESCQFKNFDQASFHIWTDIYEKEFQKFLKIPQIGLTRGYQERINEMMDKFSLFQANHAEFIRLLSLPFHNSMALMHEEIAKLAQKGDLPGEPQAYYRMWVKILEGRFMILFQKPEYVESLTKTLASLSHFSKAKDKVMEDMIQGLPIARQSEMDELSREVYELKKRIWKLEQKTEQINNLSETG